MHVSRGHTASLYIRSFCYLESSVESTLFRSIVSSFLASEYDPWMHTGEPRNKSAFTDVGNAFSIQLKLGVVGLPSGGLGGQAYRFGYIGLHSGPC